MGTQPNLIDLHDAIMADGPKHEMLTSPMMERLFDVPVRVLQSGNHYALVEEP